MVRSELALGQVAQDVGVPAFLVARGGRTLTRLGAAFGDGAGSFVGRGALSGS